MCFAKYIIEYMSQSLAGFMLMDVPRHLAACLELYVAQGGPEKHSTSQVPPQALVPPQSSLLWAVTVSIAALCTMVCIHLALNLDQSFHPIHFARCLLTLSPPVHTMAAKAQEMS